MEDDSPSLPNITIGIGIGGFGGHPRRRASRLLSFRKTAAAGERLDSFLRPLAALP
jgi:hypothetical protein